MFKQEAMLVLQVNALTEMECALTMKCVLVTLSVCMCVCVLVGFNGAVAEN